MSKMTQEIEKNIIDINTSDNNDISASCIFKNDFIGFKGHFDGNSILPGICLLQTGVVIVEKVLKKQYSLESVKNVKFFAPVFPNKQIDYNINMSNNTLKINISSDNKTTKIASFKIEPIAKG